MGYPRQTGQWANTLSLGDVGSLPYGGGRMLLEHQQRDVSGTSTPYELGDRGIARLVLYVADLYTPPAGVATLVVNIETSFDGTAWTQVDTFGPLSNPNLYRKIVVGLDRFIRLQWTLSAGGTSAFSCGGEAV